ncbi:MAG: amidohydrolase family protein [Verrucomicrobia bacterium]|nr:amidohydrolase family protein [Verrucomicrobiota bacterium]
MSLLLTNARLVLPHGVEPGWVRIEAGRVVELGKGSGPVEPGRLDIAGDYLAPGLVDEHLHGALGRDFMEADETAFATILRHHAAGGTTALLPTSVAAPWVVLERFLDRVADWQRSPRPGCPTVLGAHVEGPFLNPAKAGAQAVEHCCVPDRVWVERLVARAETVRLVTLAPELPGALEGIDRLLAAGIVPSLGHSDAWDEDVGAAFERGAFRGTHLFNAMSGARRRGPYRVAGLLEAALARRSCVVELIADGHHVSPTLVELTLRAKLPDGLRLVSDATAGCGLPEGAQFDLGGRACRVQGGVGLLADGSALAGSTIRLLDAVRGLVHRHGLPVWAAWRLGSANWERDGRLPAWCSTARSGGLRVGGPADLVRLDESLRVIHVWLRGEPLASDA